MPDPVIPTVRGCSVFSQQEVSLHVQMTGGLQSAPQYYAGQVKLDLELEMQLTAGMVGFLTHEVVRALCSSSDTQLLIIPLSTQQLLPSWTFCHPTWKHCTTAIHVFQGPFKLHIATQYLGKEQAGLLDTFSMTKCPSGRDHTRTSCM